MWYGLFIDCLILALRKGILIIEDYKLNKINLMK